MALNHLGCSHDEVRLVVSQPATTLPTTGSEKETEGGKGRWEGRWEGRMEGGREGGRGEERRGEGGRESGGGDEGRRYNRRDHVE